MRRILLTVAALVGLALVQSTPVMAGDPVFPFDPKDTAMNSAIKNARATLPVFYKEMAQTDLEAEEMLLKVAMPYGDDSREHIWVAVLQRDGENFAGYFSNDPVYIDYAQYDPVTFTEDMVSDWMYFEGDMIHGSYTTRVILPQLSADQQVSLRARLAPLP